MNTLVTGANRGIGAAIVQEFASNGYNVWACARSRDEEFEIRLSNLANEYDVQIEPVYFDLSDEAQTKQAIKGLLASKAQIDVLVNNAGIAHGGSLFMTPLHKIREVYEVNVFSQINLMQLVGRAMARNKSGCIVNICSVGGLEHSPGYVAYGSSKAALVWLTKAMARELGEYGVRVNGVAPGLIDTKMGHYKSEDELSKVFDRMVIKRFGKPSEVAKAVMYLASDDAQFMTGQILVVDGGRSI